MHIVPSKLTTTVIKRNISLNIFEPHWFLVTHYKQDLRSNVIKIIAAICLLNISKQNAETLKCKSKVNIDVKLNICILSSFLEMIFVRKWLRTSVFFHYLVLNFKLLHFTRKIVINTIHLHSNTKQLILRWFLFNALFVFILTFHGSENEQDRT